MSQREWIDRLVHLIGAYEEFFRSPFPPDATRAISEGDVTAESVCERIESALASSRADEEWERMIPSEGTIDFVMCYQPTLKRLVQWM